jgi:hypothetical protein
MNGWMGLRLRCEGWTQPDSLIGGSRSTLPHAQLSKYKGVEVPGCTPTSRHVPGDPGECGADEMRMQRPVVPVSICIP